MAREVGEGERREAQGLRREERQRYEQGRADRFAATEAARTQELADAVAAQQRQIAKEQRAMRDWKTRETELQRNRESLALLRQPPAKTTASDWMDAAIESKVLDMVPPGKPKQRLAAMFNKYGSAPSARYAKLLQPLAKQIVDRWASGEPTPEQRQKIAEDKLERAEEEEAAKIEKADKLADIKQEGSLAADTFKDAKDYQKTVRDARTVLGKIGVARKASERLRPEPVQWDTEPTKKEKGYLYDTEAQGGVLSNDWIKWKEKKDKIQKEKDEAQAELEILADELGVTAAQIEADPAGLSRIAAQYAGAARAAVAAPRRRASAVLAGRDPGPAPELPQRPDFSRPAQAPTPEAAPQAPPEAPAGPPVAPPQPERTQRPVSQMGGAELTSLTKGKTQGELVGEFGKEWVADYNVRFSAGDKDQKQALFLAYATLLQPGINAAAYLETIAGLDSEDVYQLGEWLKAQGRLR